MSRQSLDEPRWRINPTCRLRWRHWGEDYILYNAASSQTHYLNELGAAVLRLLEKRPGGRVDLAGRLAEAYELDPDEGLQRQLAALLRDMDELGLVEPVEP